MREEGLFTCSVILLFSSFHFLFRHPTLCPNTHPEMWQEFVCMLCDAECYRVTFCEWVMRVSVWQVKDSTRCNKVKCLFSALLFLSCLVYGLYIKHRCLCLSLSEAVLAVALLCSSSSLGLWLQITHSFNPVLWRSTHIPTGLLLSEGKEERYGSVRWATISTVGSGFFFVLVKVIMWRRWADQRSAELITAQSCVFLYTVPASVLVIDNAYFVLKFIWWDISTK